MLVAATATTMATLSTARAEGPRTADHARLGVFIGKWNIVGDMPPSALSPGGHCAGAHTGCRLPKSFSKTGRWASGVRAMHRNVLRTRSVGRPSRGAQNPRRPCARKPGAPTAARRAQPPIEATAIRAPRSRLLGVALQPVVWMASGALPHAPRDRDSLAPAGLPRFLDLEVPARANWSTARQLGACGSRAHHGARESALGRATHSRRIAQARP
jgi:hypothetical protein